MWQNLIIKTKPVEEYFTQRNNPYSYADNIENGFTKQSGELLTDNQIF